MSLINQESVNKQLAKFNENLQKVVLKTKVITVEIMKKDKSIAEKYGMIPPLLDIAINVIQGDTQFPGFDRIYGTLYVFLDKYVSSLERGINLFDMINSRDDRILTHHLSALFPKNEYVDKIQFLYGANPQGKRYVNEDDVESIWKLINGVMHRAIKWVILSRDPKYIDKISLDVIDKYSIVMNN